MLGMNEGFKPKFMLFRAYRGNHHRFCGGLRRASKEYYLSVF
ncbi:MAG: hypothetical protein HDR80_10975 [Bacteroides sp.]|nr:hypothetical protein [Bacteroides sp.]